MGDMFLILAPSKGFSMAVNPMVSFALTPDRPWLPWQRKFENFNRKLAITELLWETCSWFLHQVGGFRRRRIQWCHLHLLQTDRGCHGNENLKILTENCVQLSFYGRYVPNSCTNEGVFGVCKFNGISEICLRPTPVATVTKIWKF